MRALASGREARARSMGGAAVRLQAHLYYALERRQVRVQLGRELVAYHTLRGELQVHGRQQLPELLPQLVLGHHRRAVVPIRGGVEGGRRDAVSARGGEPGRGTR